MKTLAGMCVSLFLALALLSGCGQSGSPGEQSNQNLEKQIDKLEKDLSDAQTPDDVVMNVYLKEYTVYLKDGRAVQCIIYEYRGGLDCDFEGAK